MLFSASYKFHYTYVDKIMFLESIPPRLPSRFEHSFTRETEQISYVSGRFPAFRPQPDSNHVPSNPYSNQGWTLSGVSTIISIQAGMVYILNFPETCCPPSGVAHV